MGNETYDNECLLCGDVFEAMWKIDVCDACMAATHESLTVRWVDHQTSKSWDDIERERENE